MNIWHLWRISETDNALYCTIRAKYCMVLQMTALLDAILNYFNYPRVTRWNPLGSFVAYSSSTPFIK